MRFLDQMYDGRVCVNELCDKSKQLTYFNTTSEHMGSSHSPLLIALAEKMFFENAFLYIVQNFNLEITADKKDPTV